MSQYEPCKFTPAPDPELICGICMNVLDTPYETPCRHVFCRDCILTAVRENQKCPVCRAPCREEQSKEVLPLVQNLINKLTMRCDNFDNGCTDLILKEFFMDHVKSCEYAMVQCRYKSCGQYMLKRDCENHELNTCAYRDRACDNGCGLMIPMENTDSHNCIEALLALVKDLKEKNLELQKRVDQLQQAPVSTVKSESPLAPGNNQNDDNWSTNSITYDDNSLPDSYNDSSSFSTHSWAIDTATDDDWSELSDLANDSSNNYENTDGSLENDEINDGHNTDETPDYQVVEEIISADNNQSQSANSAIHGNVVPLECSSLAAFESCESPFVLDYPSSGTSPKTTTACLSASTDKRQREDDSRFCDDNTDKTQSKRIKLSDSQQQINAQTEDTTLTSTSLCASNTSNIQLLEGAKNHSYRHKRTDQGCHSAVEVSHTSSSASTNTVNSNSTITNDDNPLRRDPVTRSRCGPVTRSRGQNLHIEFEDNAIPCVKVPPSFVYLLDRYAQEDDSSDDESWSPSHAN